MKCPVDGATLVMSERQNIEIDYCPECRGVWLDRGELDKIIERADQAAPAAAGAAPAHRSTSRRRRPSSGTGATTPISTRRSVGAARRRRRTSSASCSTTESPVISRRLALGLLAGGVLAACSDGGSDEAGPTTAPGDRPAKTVRYGDAASAGGRPVAAPPAAHRAGGGGGPHPRRLLAAHLRPDADGAAGPRRGPARLGRLEPRVPGLGQRRRGLAGDVRGRGRGHRRARPGGRPPAPRPRAGGHRGPLGRRVPLAVGRGPGRPARRCARCRSGGRAGAGRLPGRGEQPGGRRVREARQRCGRRAHGRAAQGGG